MKRFFSIADSYIKESNWVTFAAIKFCLFSLGALFGLHAFKRYRKGFGTACAFVFVVTYIPLIAKFFRIAKREL